MEIGNEWTRESEHDKEKIVELVVKAARILGGEFNVTQKGIPRIILRLRDYKVSIVYLGSSGQWKLFWPFPAKEQQKMYFETFMELEAYVNKNR